MDCSEIAFVLGRRDKFAHENRRKFDGNFTRPYGNSEYDKWLLRYHSQVYRSKDTFVKHFQDKYGTGGPLPIWIAIELWDFGLTSKAFSGMTYNDQAAVSQRFSVSDPMLMQSWLQSLNYVRNVIAHHSRLWNLNLNVTPRRPKLGEIADFDVWHLLPTVHTRVYSVCCILSFLSNVINANSPWIGEFKSQIGSFPNIPNVSIGAMGFPPAWESHGFWT